MIRLPIFASFILALVLPLQADHVRAVESSAAGVSEFELLSPREAFKLEALARGNLVRLIFEIAEGYYLYRDRLFVKTAAGTPQQVLGEILKPAGVEKNDPLFGVVEIYRKRAIIDVPLKTLPADGRVQLAVTSQGCADVGVCFPPQTQQLQIVFNSSAATPTTSGGALIDRLARLGQLFVAQSPTDSSTDFPPPDEVFRLDALALDANTVQVRFAISEGFYLYRGRMQFSLDGSGSEPLTGIELPPGTLKRDPYFGELQVYYRGVDIPVRVQGREARVVSLKVGYQGCAEAGLCYPPQSKVLRIALPLSGGGGQSAGPVSGSRASVGTLGQLSQTDQLARSLARGSLVLVLVSFFGWGLLLAFTPCVLPMVPILAAIIAGQGERLGGKRGFALAAVYVLTMALTYTGAGISAALLGQNLQALFQTPVVLVVFSGVFIALSAAMFGLYELQIPSAWQTRLRYLSQVNSGGRYGGVAVMGALSALIVGPCVAAPLAAALIVIGGSGDPVRGGLALFVLSLGMGVPLLAVGAFGDRVMPKMGPWMIRVKQLFGLMLLAAAIYLLSRILPDWVVMCLWSGLLILAAVFIALGSDWGSGQITLLRTRQGLGVLALVYAGLLTVGAATGSGDPLNPLAKVFGDEQHTLNFRRVGNVLELEGMLAAAKREGQPVMLDFYADWCITCKQLEAQTFTDLGVQAALENTLLLQVDVSAYNHEHKALLARYNLLGPPAILFFNLQSNEIRAQRIIGFMDVVDLKRTIDQALRI